jgi:hypothetical protein
MTGARCVEHPFSPVEDFLALTLLRPHGSPSIYADPPWPYGNQATRAATGERSRVLEELRAKGHNPPAFKTCARNATMARTFETLRRRKVLSFEHHAAVASLDTQEQDWLLDRGDRRRSDAAPDRGFPQQARPQRLVSLVSLIIPGFASVCSVADREIEDGKAPLFPTPQSSLPP